MTVLTVILIIFLVLLLLLCIPVRLHMGYRGQTFELYLYILFLHFDLSPDKLMAKMEKDKKKKPKKAKKAKAEDAPDKKKKKKPSDLAPYIRPLLRSSKLALNLIRKNLVFYRIRINARISGPDASQTAITYGKVSSLLAVLLSILGEIFILRKPSVHVSPDFTKDKSIWDISLRVRIPPIALLAAALALAAGLVRLLAKRTPKRKKSNNTNRKGGYVHEPATPH